MSKIGIKKVVKKILKIIGLYPFLILLRPPANKPEHPKTKGHSIEFIGPSGVGKSTLFEEIKNRTAGEWYFREKLPGLTLKHNQDMMDGGLHWKVLFAKSVNLEERLLNGFRKAKLMRYFSEVILHDLHLIYGLSDRGFLLEEGICHNFSKELNDLPDDDFKKIMAGRALVYLKPKNSSIVVKRIRERAKNGGHIVTHHIGLTDNQLREIAETNMTNFDTLTSRAQAIGIPVCTVYAEDDINQSAKTLLDFERRLIRDEGIN